MPISGRDNDREETHNPRTGKKTPLPRKNYCIKSGEKVGGGPILEKKAERKGKAYC